LIVFSFITKNLKINNANIPPVFNFQILEQVLTAVGMQANFGEKYTEALLGDSLKNGIFEKVNTDNIIGEWIKIPSKYSDPENFKANVDKVKILSQDHWCTRSYHADLYLSQGDLYFFRENGKTQLGLRFAENEIQEIQGYLNNRTIPVAYTNIVKNFIDNHNFQTTNETAENVNQAVKTKPKYDKIKQEIEKLMSEKNYKLIFKRFGLDVQETPEGKLILGDYEFPENTFRLEDLKINEQDLFSDVIEVGNINFEDIPGVKNIRHWNKLAGKIIPWEELENLE